MEYRASFIKTLKELDRKDFRSIKHMTQAQILENFKEFIKNNNGELEEDISFGFEELDSYLALMPNMEFYIDTIVIINNDNGVFNYRLAIDTKENLSKKYGDITKTYYDINSTIDVHDPLYKYHKDPFKVLPMAAKPDYGCSHFGFVKGCNNCIYMYSYDNIMKFSKMVQSVIEFSNRFIYVNPSLVIMRNLLKNY